MTVIPTLQIQTHSVLSISFVNNANVFRKVVIAMKIFQMLMIFVPVIRYQLKKKEINFDPRLIIF